MTRDQGQIKKDQQMRDSLRRGVYVLPSLLTSGSLFMGFYSLASTYTGAFERAALAIIAAAVFDGLDGRLARATGTTTRFGVEYDSLADVIAFGAAPAFLVYGWSLSGFGRWGWIVSFLFCICGALRLARFNVQVNTVEKGQFNGLPIPAAAISVASIVMLFYYLGGSGSFRHLAVLLAIFVLALLMVSTIKFNSFKDMEIFRRSPFNTLVVFVFLALLLAMEPQVVIFLLISGYVVSGPIGELYRMLWLKKGEKEKEIHGNDA